jgi:uncharacterized membrane protein YkvA (DUF1232 family)
MSALVPSGSNAVVPVPTKGLEPETTQASEDALAPTGAAGLAISPTEVAVPAISPAAAESPDEGDPFPREAWATLTSHAAGYLRLTLALLRDPAVSKHRRAALLAAAAYFASPIDLIPGIVPVLGQIDDLAVAMLAIRLALNALEPARRQQHLAAAGLSDETLREDLAAAGRLGLWTARAGARTGIRVGRGALRVTVRTGRAVADVALRGGRAAARRAAPKVDPATDAAGDAAASSAQGVSDARPARTSAAASRVAGATGRVSGAAGRVTDAGRGLATRIRRRTDVEALAAELEPHETDPTDEPAS